MVFRSVLLVALMLSLACQALGQTREQATTAKDACSEARSELDAALSLATMKAGKIQRMINGVTNAKNRLALQTKLNKLRAAVSVTRTAYNQNTTTFWSPGVVEYNAGRYGLATSLFEQGTREVGALLWDANDDLASLDALACDPLFYQQ